jgi:hypothetical protein
MDLEHVPATELQDRFHAIYTALNVGGSVTRYWCYSAHDSSDERRFIELVRAHDDSDDDAELEEFERRYGYGPLDEARLGFAQRFTRRLS